MSSRHYHFTTHWRVNGSVAEVAEILADGPDLTRWWPSVYLDVRQIEPGGPDGVGNVLDLYTKGWLPYTLRWQSRVTDNKHPFGYSIAASGDFTGRSVWVFSQEVPYVDITFFWAIEAGKPLLRRASFLLKALFEANHHWAIGQGERSLRLGLARRRAKTDAERAAFPPTSRSYIRVQQPARLAAGDACKHGNGPILGGWKQRPPFPLFVVVDHR